MAKKTTKKVIKTTKKTSNPELIVNTLDLTNESDTKLAIINAKIAAAKENVNLTIDELKLISEAIYWSVKDACVAESLKSIFENNTDYFVNRNDDNLNVSKIVYDNQTEKQETHNVFKRACNWIKSKFSK